MKNGKTEWEIKYNFTIRRINTNENDSYINITSLQEYKKSTNIIIDSSGKEMIKESQKKIFFIGTDKYLLCTNPEYAFNESSNNYNKTVFLKNISNKTIINEFYIDGEIIDVTYSKDLLRFIVFKNNSFNIYQIDNNDINSIKLIDPHIKNVSRNDMVTFFLNDTIAIFDNFSSNPSLFEIYISNEKVQKRKISIKDINNFKNNNERYDYRAFRGGMVYLSNYIKNVTIAIPFSEDVYSPKSLFDLLKCSNKNIELLNSAQFEKKGKKHILILDRIVPKISILPYK